MAKLAVGDIVRHEDRTILIIDAVYPDRIVARDVDGKFTTCPTHVVVPIKRREAYRIVSANCFASPIFQVGQRVKTKNRYDYPASHFHENYDADILNVRESYVVIRIPDKQLITTVPSSFVYPVFPPSKKGQ